MRVGGSVGVLLEGSLQPLVPGEIGPEVRGVICKEVFVLFLFAEPSDVIVEGVVTS